MDFPLALAHATVADALAALVAGGAVRDPSPFTDAVRAAGEAYLYGREAIYPAGLAGVSLLDVFEDLDPPTQAATLLALELVAIATKR